MVPPDCAAPDMLALKVVELKARYSRANHLRGLRPSRSVCESGKVVGKHVLEIDHHEH